MQPNQNFAVDSTKFEKGSFTKLRYSKIDILVTEHNRDDCHIKCFDTE